MRVQEIISEGIWDKALGIGARLMSKKPEVEAMEKLAAHWANEISATGKATTKASAVIGKDLAKDKALVAKATKEAEKIAAGSARAKNVAVIKMGASEFASKINTLAKWGIATAPIVQYNIRMNKWQKKLEAGEITPEEFEAIRQKELATMVGQMSVSLGSLAVFKSFATGAKFLVNWIPKLGPVLSGALTASSTVGAGLVAWWASQSGREWITWAICDAFVDLSPILGGVPARVIDMFKDKVDELKTGKQSAGQPAASAAQQPGQAAAFTGTTAPAGKPTAYQPNSLAGSNMQTTTATDAEGKPSFDIGWKN